MYQITLRMARDNCRLTLKEVSKRTGIPVSTIHRWERDSGKARLPEILQLLAVYKVSMNHIYCGREDEALERLRMAVTD